MLISRKYQSSIFPLRYKAGRFMEIATDGRTCISGSNRLMVFRRCGPRLINNDDHASNISRRARIANGATDGRWPNSATCRFNVGHSAVLADGLMQGNDYAPVDHRVDGFPSRVRNCCLLGIFL
jgi:hypothetical protein